MRRLPEQKVCRARRSACGERKHNFAGWHFWSRGYFVQTLGRDEAVTQECMTDQEREDERRDKVHLRR